MKYLRMSLGATGVFCSFVGGLAAVIASLQNLGAWALVVVPLISICAFASAFKLIDWGTDPK